MSSTYIPSPSSYGNLQDNCLPVQVLTLNRAPTVNDRYQVTTLAVDVDSGTSYQLNQYVSGDPQWVALGGSHLSGIITLNGIFPDGTGNFTLAAGTGVTLTPGTNTITIGLSGAGIAIDSLTLQAGTTPCVPDGNGNITFSGAVVAAGTNPVRTNGTAANTTTLQIQTAQAIASTNATNIGLCAFDSASFAVDANGFVTLAGGGLAVDSFTPNSGTTPVVPDSNGNIVLQGAGSITVVGGTNSLTPQLTGLTNHAVLVGAGTDTITKVGPTATAGQVLQSAGSSADPAFSTATYPSTTVVSEILYSSSTNVVAGLATANRAVLTSGATGIPVMTALATDGQLIIGSTAGVPAAATLTAGSGISIVNASNSITISSTSAEAAWTFVSASGNLAVNTSYMVNGGTGINLLLPATSAQGDVIQIGSTGAGNVFTITQGASQQILSGTAASTIGGAGNIVSDAVGGWIRLVCVTANTTWQQVGIAGPFTTN